jgi:hypothetical protein
MKHQFENSHLIVFLVLCLLALTGLSLLVAARNGGDANQFQGEPQRADLAAGPADGAELHPGRSYVFIVKFKADEGLAEILALYRPQRERAVQAFGVWARDKPAFRGLALDRVAYSGEALLIYDPRTDDRIPRPTLDEITQQLNASPLVRYAELDSILEIDSDACLQNCTQK